MRIRRDAHEGLDGLGSLVSPPPVDRIIILAVITPSPTSKAAYSTDRRNEAEIRTDTANPHIVQHWYIESEEKESGPRVVWSDVAQPIANPDAALSGGWPCPEISEGENGKSAPFADGTYETIPRPQSSDVQLESPLMGETKSIRPLRFVPRGALLNAGEGAVWRNCPSLFSVFRARHRSSPAFPARVRTIPHGAAAGDYTRQRVRKTAWKHLPTALMVKWVDRSIPGEDPARSFTCEKASPPCPWE